VSGAGCGIVGPAGDPAAIAAAVRTVASDPLLREAMSDAAREAAVLHHSWKQRAAQTDTLLRGLVRDGQA